MWLKVNRLLATSGYTLIEKKVCWFNFLSTTYMTIIQTKLYSQCKCTFALNKCITFNIFFLKCVIFKHRTELHKPQSFASKRNELIRNAHNTPSCTFTQLQVAYCVANWICGSQNGVLDRECVHWKRYLQKMIGSKMQIFRFGAEDWLKINIS